MSWCLGGPFVDVVGRWRWRRFSVCGVRANLFFAPNLTFEEGMVPISSVVFFWRR